MKAFVLVALHNGTEKHFLNELKSYRQVKNAYLLFGEWDVLAEMEMSNTEDIATFVMDKIRARDEVRLTSSLVVAGQ